MGGGRQVPLKKSDSISAWEALAWIHSLWLSCHGGEAWSQRASEDPLPGSRIERTPGEVGAGVGLPGRSSEAAWDQPEELEARPGAIVSIGKCFIGCEDSLCLPVILPLSGQPPLWGGTEVPQLGEAPGLGQSQIWASGLQPGS